MGAGEADLLAVELGAGGYLALMGFGSPPSVPWLCWFSSDISVAPWCRDLPEYLGAWFAWDADAEVYRMVGRTVDGRIRKATVGAQGGILSEADMWPEGEHNPSGLWAVGGKLFLENVGQRDATTCITTRIGRFTADITWPSELAATCVPYDFQTLGPGLAATSGDRLAYLVGAQCIEDPSGRQCQQSGISSVTLLTPCALG